MRLDTLLAVTGMAVTVLVCCARALPQAF
jgi:hypothetical protein